MTRRSLPLSQSVALGAVTAFVFLPLARSAASQTQASQVSAPVPATDTAFDVASVKPNQTLGGRSHLYRHPDTGEFTAVNVTLRQLLAFAYDLPESEILGGPAWLGSDRFDVEAKSDPAVDAAFGKLGDDERRAAKGRMVAALLADRFACRSHREKRDLPIYALVQAKAGSRLTESKANGTMVNTRTPSAGVASISDQGVLLTVVADQLSGPAGRVIVDRTGLSGRYDITLSWTPDRGPDAANSPADGSAPPSLFTAIEEQLGLRLEATRGPVAVLMIDRATAPTPN